MSDPDPAFDAIHPSGQLMFRSSRGGCLHSVVLSDVAMTADAPTLARAVLLAADVSYLHAVMQIRQEIIEAGFTPSPQIQGPSDLDIAEGALRRSRVHIAVAVTGVAGPGGGSADKPVGSVWFGWATKAGVVTQLHHLDGDRQQVRQATVLRALQGLNDLLMT